MNPNPDNDNWMPLESNPQVMNEQALKIGMNIQNASFQDLLGFEEWAFEMIPKPIYGVIFNFPIKENTKEFDNAEKENILQKGQKVSQNLFYMKQYAKNACGTIAMVHVLLNSQNNDLILKDSLLAKFKEESTAKTPEDIGKMFQAQGQIKQFHKEAVVQGDSQVCDDIDRHFIAFVLKDGDIYELDGGKEFPINHGASNEDNFLADTSKIIQKFFDRDPQEVQFSTVVLAKPAEE